MSELVLDAQAKRLRWLRLSNTVLLAVAFVFVFVAYGIVQGLASSILSPSVAFWFLSLLYFSFAFCNLMVSSTIVKLLGSRRTMMLGSICYLVLEICNIIAVQNSTNELIQYMLLMPSSVLLGLGASILWTGHGKWMTELSTKETMGTYSGIFFGIYQSSIILGALLPALLLIVKIPTVTVLAITTSLGFVGVLLMEFICHRPMPEEPEDEQPVQASTQTLSLGNRLLETVRMIKYRNIVLLLPLAYVYAFEMAFYSGTIPLFINSSDSQDQTRDLAMKLYVTATSGSANVVVSVIVGKLLDKLGARPISLVLLGVFGTVVILLTALNPFNNLPLLFGVAPGFGTTEAIIMTLTYSLLGKLFDRSIAAPAFAFHRFNMAFGTGLGFAVSKLMLKSNGDPNMAIWSPLLLTLLCLCVGGIFMTKSDPAPPEANVLPADAAKTETSLDENGSE
ncbi:major facilitator superfamily domain-containing protein [Polychytrium aggregatum]|uniref:major facilitator superfamily domain-containing protein n=1 Tax=Polychytrium aggregatum TaxID=110093 RepID=UPI0022FED6C8|nr:major facilitator superfamily domain-containing protein [Polychytrium aggregatum]KAI9209690.1 major facilitator superfamily domain-containing protein [Polychytrium aggregatum]